MINYILELPDGTRIRSGAGESNAIESVTLTKSVNSGTELTLGSVCCTALEISIISTGTPLLIEAGSEVILYENDTEKITQSQVGIFTVEKPTKASANRYKVTGYDRVSRLDKDVSAWLKGIKSWPINILTLGRMVCEECDVILNDFGKPLEMMVPGCPTTAAITGRQLLQWIAEIVGRFVTANAEGILEYGWYQSGWVNITPSGDNYFFEGSLSYEDYTVAPADAVKVRLADSEDGVLWPEGIKASNPYIIHGNKIVEMALTDGTSLLLSYMYSALDGFSYRPCKITVPSTTHVKPGDIVTITDKNGVTFTTAIMTTVQTGQKIECESVGGAKRENSESANNPTESELKEYADNAAETTIAASGTINYKRLLTSADDMNDIKENGVYVYQTKSVPANAPFENAAVIMVLGGNSTTTQKIQLAFRYGVPGYGKFRPLLDGGWLAWSQFAIATDGIVAIENGGTGASDPAAARANLGAAPAGYGYGGQAITIQSDGRIDDEAELTTALSAVYDQMGAAETKFVFWNGYPAAGTSTHGWFGILTRSSSNNGSIIAWSAYQYGSQIRKVKYSGTWQPMEWDNPPMEVNVEYRTTERYKGKPVYVTKLYIGSLPQGTNSIDHGLGISQSEIVRFDGLAVDTTSYNYHKLPMISSAGNISATVRLQAQKADIVCFSDLAKYEGYVTIWYLRN